MIDVKTWHASMFNYYFSIAIQTSIWSLNFYYINPVWITFSINRYLLSVIYNIVLPEMSYILYVKF